VQLRAPGWYTQARMPDDCVTWRAVVVTMLDLPQSFRCPCYLALQDIKRRKAELDGRSPLDDRAPVRGV